MSYLKNTASQKFNVLAVNTATGLPVTGDSANVTAKISIDSAAFASLTDTNPTELDATNAPGVYVFDLSQSETNGDVLTIIPSSSTANVQMDMLNIYTVVLNDYKADVSALATSSALATVDTNVDAVLVDTGTSIPAQITALNDFDPASDAVANVTLCATTTTNTDMRGTDNAAAASSLSITNSSVNTIKGVTDNLPDSGALTSLATASALSTVDTVVDAILVDTGTTIPAQITALNNFDPASDAVANVTLVGTTTTNTDMRGTDSANTVAPANSDITAIKAKTDQFVFTVSNQVDANSLTGGTSPTDVADAVWDEAYASHTTAGTFGKLMDQLRKANQAIDGEIDGASTTTSLNTNLTGYTDEAFDSELLLFVSGALNGESRPVLSYNGTTGVMTFEEPWTQAPSSSDEFVVLPAHIHAISEISLGVFNKFTDGSNEDLFKADVSGLNTVAPDNAGVAAIKAKTDQMVFTIANQIDANALTSAGNAGTGANTVTLTVKHGAILLENAVIGAIEGVNNYIATTNASGQAVFNLDNASYTIAIYKSGYSFAGATLVVSGTNATTYSMSQITIPTTANPDTVTAYINLFDEAGAKASVACSAELYAPPTGTLGTGYVPNYQAGTTSVAGLFTCEVYKGATYKLVLNGVETYYVVPADAADPYKLPSTLAGC